MSDLSIYELEDIVWDDFGGSGDHIVPHPSNVCNDHCSEDKCEGHSCKKPRHEVTPLQKNENDLYASGSVCQAEEERDPTSSNKERNMIQSGDTKILYQCFNSSDVTSGGELRTDEGIHKDASAGVDGKSYNFRTSQISQSDDVSLFSNYNDKESSGLLYYEWPDILNFEDVDKMLSNCDSSFGLGIPGDDDELVWFTSEDPAGGYEEALKVDPKFPCSEPCSLTNTSQDYKSRESDNKRYGCMSESRDDFKLKDQHANLQKEQLRQQNWTEENKAGQMITGIKYESMGLISPSHKETYIAPNQVPPMHISLAAEVCGNIKTRHSPALHSPVSGNQKQTHLMPQDSTIDMVSSQKQSCTPGNKIESQSDMEEGKKGTELGQLAEPEGASVNSELEEISLEATSCRQLQQVMEQLDLRTKLCIRDSLYRLARSAEQRHNYVGNTTANCGVPLMTEGTNKCSDFMDMETNTNPIDRTIAHLLFHRPSDSSKLPIPSPIKPNIKVHGSAMGEQVGKKQYCQDEAANQSDDKISSTASN